MWNEVIEKEKKKDYFKSLMEFVNEEYEKFVCYPPYEQIFAAFTYTPFDQTKVVILGQDPYHEINQAHGLAFSVKCDKLPPSLINLFIILTYISLTVNEKEQYFPQFL